MSHTYSPLLYCRIPQTFKYHKRCFYRAVYLLYNSQCTNIENSTNIELYFFLTRVYFNITFFTFHKLTPLYWRKKTIKNVTDPSLQIPAPVHCLVRNAYKNPNSNFLFFFHSLPINDMIVYRTIHWNKHDDDGWKSKEKRWKFDGYEVCFLVCSMNQ